MIKEAVYSDCSKWYCSPEHPNAGDRVRISLRTYAEDEAEVFLCMRDSKERMFRYKNVGNFAYYCAFTVLSKDTFVYSFEIHCRDEVFFYDRMGLCDSPRSEFGFAIVPGFDTPEWAKGAVMYQILVDRFFRGDFSNDVESGEYYYIKTPVKKISDWNEPPKDFDVANFYGGDLEGVRQKLSHLKKLGIEVIYFNPLFVSPSNHKYDTQDYDYIDPHIAKIVNDGGDLLPAGETDNSHATKYIRRITDKENLEASNRFFAEFVKEAHEKGIKVIIDGVFNHCGSFNKWLDREGIYKDKEGYATGAYWSEESPYSEFFSFKERTWPKNESYDGWWDHNTLPKLNYENSEKLKEYILDIAEKWVSPPYNVDGWRLDVAADLGHSESYNHDFWKRFRNRVKAANPDAVILAEHYGDAKSWLLGDEWDTVMNYDGFMEPVSYFLTGMEKHSDSFDSEALGDGVRFQRAMNKAFTQFLNPSLMCAMNQLSNHDHSRFLTRTNHKSGRVGTLGSEAAGQGVNKGVFRAAVMMQMTLPGAPTLYYGDEVGVVGFTDPDSRRTFPWDNMDYGLLDFHRDIIYLHKSSEALRKGAFIFLKCEKDCVCFSRFTTEEKIVVVINSSGENKEFDIPVWPAEVPYDSTITQIMSTHEEGYSILPLEHSVKSGWLHIKMLPFGGAVLKKVV